MTKLEVGKFYKDARPNARYYIEVLGEADSEFFGKGLIHGQFAPDFEIPFAIFVRPLGWGNWVEITKDEFTELTRAPKAGDNTIKMDGTEHGPDCGGFCEEQVCSHCNLYMHYQPVYGGYYYECPGCNNRGIGRGTR